MFLVMEDNMNEFKKHKLGRPFLASLTILAILAIIFGGSVPALAAPPGNDERALRNRCRSWFLGNH